MNYPEFNPDPHNGKKILKAIKKFDGKIIGITIIGYNEIK